MNKSIHKYTREEWRSWLCQNHSTEKEIWLIYFKKHTGKPRIPYNDAVEEAICFGWIDSIVKKIDDERYQQKFTPRKDIKNWSLVNIKRAIKMIEENKMTEAGLEKVKDALALYRENPGLFQKQKEEVEIPKYFIEQLNEDSNAKKSFESLSPGKKKLYIKWITSAKKKETRIKRTKEAITLLSEGKELGLK